MKYLFTLLLLFLFSLINAQLVINEISQGTANAEYVELLVIGDNDGCSSECVDLRGWILDDNNGAFSSAPQAGNGIAPGHIRLKNIAFWECIKVGSIIVFYNDGDVNAAIPAADETDANGDCVYIIPYNSTNLEHTTSIPNLTNTSYTPATYTSGGNWNTVIMQNDNDTYQLIAPTDLTTHYHAVSWGNNNFGYSAFAPDRIYFSGSTAGEVMYMANTTNNDPFSNSIFANGVNWINETINASNETPGIGNTPANIAWIDTLSNGCVPFVPAFMPMNDTLCIGESSSLSASGGGTYEWSTTETTPDISVFPTGDATYTVTISSDYGCTSTGEIPITVTPPPSPTIMGNSLLCEPNTLTLDAGGPYAEYDWAPNGEMTQMININAAGDYTVTVTDSNMCTGTSEISILSVDLNFIRD